MMHKPIRFKNVSLSFPHKICFDDFNADITHGSRIAIIGRNGGGKSTLLKMLQGDFAPTSGEIILPDDVQIGYVPQVIEEFENLSGGERLNAALTKALCTQANVLIMDEPTNHLDRRNRKSLLRMLDTFPGTLIIVSHDVELLRDCMDCFWHIDNSQIHQFTGCYDDYLREISVKRASITREIAMLEKQKKVSHQDLMQEQQRAAKSRKKGAKSIEQRKWPSIVSNAKALRAEETTGNKKAQIHQQKQELIAKLSDLRLPEIIVPKFSLTADDLQNNAVVTICEGSVSYSKDKTLLDEINFHLGSGERISIMGDNGSGKSTLIKAILNNPDIIKTGSWIAPKPTEIGYLDQHYGTLNPLQTVLESLQKCVPTWQELDCRRHLCDFLFFNNTEVNARISTLSGGEKARLSLAHIAANTPKLLILDEITNNLDLETRDHVIQVLQAYPGSLIVISHDEEFLKSIGVHNQHWTL